MTNRLLATLALALALAGLALSCTKKAEPPPPSLDPELIRREMEAAHAQAASRVSTDLVARGRTIYMTSCTACHNADPKRAGALGPDVYGSSLELLTTRVLGAGYPPGYKPKRGSRTMAPLPQLRGEIPALHAFLNAK